MSTWQYSPVEYEGKESGAQVLVQQGNYVVPQQGVDLNNLFIYQLKGKPAFAYADIHLQPNQRIVSDGNSLLWMDEKIDEPDTTCWGGPVQSCARTLAGEKCCFNTYTNKDQQRRKISFSFNDPGDMLSFGVSPGNGWILTRGAFVAGTDNLDVTGRCIGCCACLLNDFVGEGAILTRVRLREGEQGPAVFLAGSFGQLVRHDVPQGQVLMVSKGLFFAAHETTRFSISLVGGCKNLCCTGSGVVMQFFGPCVIYTQSRNPGNWNPLKQPLNSRQRQAGVGLQ